MTWTQEALIITPLQAENSTEAIQILGERLHLGGFVKDTFVKAVLEREKTFATGLPTPKIQVAIPHADIEHVLRSALAIGVLEEPVPFGEMGNPNSVVDVKIVCMLAVTQSETLVSLLQQLVGIFQDVEVLKSIVEAADAAEIASIFNNRLPTNQEV